MMNSIRQILKGAEEINEKLKYQAITCIIGLVHVCFMLAFFSYHLTLLAWYNIFIIAFYVFLVLIIGRINRYSWVFLAAFLEIVSHSILATAFTGWRCGFMYYSAAMIPMSFYITYTIAYLRRKLYIPVIVSMVVFTSYFVLWGTMGPDHSLYGELIVPSFSKGFYVFNNAMFLMFLLITSLMFSIEIRYMQYHLEAENVSLSRMANFDALTRLMNRRSMNVQLKQVMDDIELNGADSENAFCLLMADIDDFKKVNDTYGHAKGDEVLLEVARVLQSNVREADKVCRWGGEEMLILLQSNIEVARNVAQRICFDMAGVEIETDDKPISVTLTIGVAEYKEGETMRSLIDLADQRMYRGKRSGKNCVVWN